MGSKRFLSDDSIVCFSLRAYCRATIILLWLLFAGSKGLTSFGREPAEFSRFDKIRGGVPYCVLLWTRPVEAITFDFVCRSRAQILHCFRTAEPRRNWRAKIPRLGRDKTKSTLRNKTITQRNKRPLCVHTQPHDSLSTLVPFFGNKNVKIKIFFFWGGGECSVDHINCVFRDFFSYVTLVTN